MEVKASWKFVKWFNDQIWVELTLRSNDHWVKGWIYQSNSNKCLNEDRNKWLTLLYLVFVFELSGPWRRENSTLPYKKLWFFSDTQHINFVWNPSTKENAILVTLCMVSQLYFNCWCLCWKSLTLGLTFSWSPSIMSSHSHNMVFSHPPLHSYMHDGSKTLCHVGYWGSYGFYIITLLHFLALKLFLFSHYHANFGLKSALCGYLISIWEKSKNWEYFMY